MDAYGAMANRIGPNRFTRPTDGTGGAAVFGIERGLGNRAKHPCLVWSGKPSDPHHLRYAQSHAFDGKASDDRATRSSAALVTSAPVNVASIHPLKVAHKL